MLWSEAIQIWRQQEVTKLDWISVTCQLYHFAERSKIGPCKCAIAPNDLRSVSVSASSADLEITGFGAVRHRRWCDPLQPFPIELLNSGLHLQDLRLPALLRNWWKKLRQKETLGSKGEAMHLEIQFQCWPLWARKATLLSSSTNDSGCQFL